jgi:hypothetical protein
MSLVKFKSNLPNAAIEPGTPLWQIVPTRGADGRPLADFMMLLPGLRNRPQHEINNTLNNIQKALEPFQDVVFVNMNLKINVLWVSANARPGVTLELIAAIQNLVPEALMVTQF